MGESIDADITAETISDAAEASASATPVTVDAFAESGAVMVEPDAEREVDDETMDAIVAADPRLAKLVEQLLVQGTEECQRLEAIAADAAADVERFCTALEASDNNVALTKRALAKRECELAALRADEQASRKSAEVASLRALECDRSLSALAKVHGVRTLRMQRLRRASAEHRRRARHTTAQLTSLRRRSAAEASWMRAEKEQLIAWRDELTLWWEAQAEQGVLSQAPPASYQWGLSDTEGEEEEEHEEDEEEQVLESEVAPYSTQSVEATGIAVTHIDELECARIVDIAVTTSRSIEEELPSQPLDYIKTMEPELSPALLPNLSRASRRIARGGHAPSKIESFFKQWVPRSKSLQVQAG